MAQMAQMAQDRLDGSDEEPDQSPSYLGQDLGEGLNHSDHSDHSDHLDHSDHGEGFQVGKGKGLLQRSQGEGFEIGE